MARGKQYRIMAVLMFAVIMMLSLTACDDYTVTAYKTLFVAGQAYDTGMKSVAELQKVGKITTEQREAINKVAGKFYTSYQAGVSALAIYNKTQSSPDNQKLVVAITGLIAEYKVFAIEINAFFPGLLNKELEVK